MGPKASKMAHVDEDEAVRLLVQAQRTGGHSKIDPAPLAGLDRAGAYRVVLAQQEALGEEVGLYKTSLMQPDGTGIIAPIWRSRVGTSPGFCFPTAAYAVKGLEFEVGVKLGRDVPAGEGVDEAAVAAAVESYFVGIEIVGTRLVEPSTGGQPGPAAGLADNLSALGYVFGGESPRGRDVDGLEVSFELDGRVLDKRTAKPGFGTVLTSVVAYARAQHPDMPLKAGTVITPGSLNGCVLLPPGSTGRVVGRLGSETTVEFTLS
ncbi:hypothetical protein RB595_008702 [Gaeumannomyces hyphopodioides]